MRDLAELGAHPGSENDRAPFAGDHRGAREQRVAAAQHLGFRARLGYTRLGQGLPGECGHVDPQSASLDHTAIGSNFVPRLHQDHVPGDQRLRGKPHRVPAAKHGDHLRQQRAQRGDGAIGAILLPEGEQPVDDDHAEDGVAQRAHAHAGVAQLRDERKPRRQPQDEREKMRELASEAKQQRFALEFLDAIGAELRQAPGRRLRGQPQAG